MFGLPRRASILWVGVVVAAAAACAFAVPVAWTNLRWASIAALFALACAIAESFMVTMPTSRQGNSVHYTLGGTVVVTALLVMPLPWAILAVALGKAIGNRTVWFKRAYNVAQNLLAAAAAGFVWRYAPDAAHVDNVINMPWLGAAVAVTFVITTGLTSAIFASATGMPIRATYWRSNRNTWPAYMGMLFLGVLIAILWSLSAWTIALAAIPLT